MVPPGDSEAARFVSQPQFHQQFTLPASADHGDLTVSYAVVGASAEVSAPADDPPTVLFIPGLFASRCIAIPMHTIAKAMGVRVISVDRPGMGDTTAVPLEQRIPVWVELVPKLLAHLQIKHVALVAHSSGTVYLLNTLIECRDILHPTQPSVSLLAPWVDPARSGMTTWRLAQYLPSSVFSIMHHFPRFYLFDAQPVLASSGAALTRVTNAISLVRRSEPDSAQDAERRYIEERYGVSRAFQTELDGAVMKAMFSQHTEGANSEALQCLRKGPPGLWRRCDDYAAFVRDMAEAERARPPVQDAARLKVRAYFAETDDMIGNGGREYFDKCWQQQDAALSDVIDYDSSVKQGSNHDSVLQCLDVLERVLVDAGGTSDQIAVPGAS